MNSYLHSIYNAFNAALNAFDGKEYHEAIRLFDEAISLDNKYYLHQDFSYLDRELKNKIARALFKFGKIYFDRKEFAEAITWLDYSVKFDPDLKDANFYFYRSYAYAAQKKWQHARSDLDRVLKLDPGNKKAFFNIGVVCYKEKRWEEAIRNFTAALPDYKEQVRGLLEEIYIKRGLDFLAKNPKEYENAISEFDNAIELNPRSAMAYYHRAKSHIDWGYTEIGLGVKLSWQTSKVLSDFWSAIILNSLASIPIPKEEFKDWHYPDVFNQHALDYIFSAPTESGVPTFRGVSLHEIIKGILTPDTPLNKFFSDKDSISRVLAQYCKGPQRKGLTAEDAQFSFDVAKNFEALVGKNSSVTIIVTQMAILDNALAKKDNKQEVFELIKNNTKLQAEVRKASSMSVITCYLQLLGACARQGMSSKDLLDLLERPLEPPHKHNTASLVAYFKDASLLAMYASILQHCADSAENKKRVTEFLEARTVGFGGIFNIGGNKTLAKLFQSQGIDISKASPTRPEAIQVKTSSSGILQATRSASDDLKPIYVPPEEVAPQPARDEYELKTIYKAYQEPVVLKPQGEQEKVEREQVKSEKAKTEAQPKQAKEKPVTSTSSSILSTAKPFYDELAKLSPPKSQVDNPPPVKNLPGRKKTPGV